MIQISETDARSRLDSMLQSASEPLLTQAEVEALLVEAKRADADGLAPSDTGWTPTWDLNAAAAEGWRRKAGKVAGRFDVTVDGDALRRSQMFSACLVMADRYARKISGVVSQSVHRLDKNQVANL